LSFSRLRNEDLRDLYRAIASVEFSSCRVTAWPEMFQGWKSPSIPTVVSTTLSTGATCKIPNLEWCLKFEYFERDPDREDEEKAVICVIPASEKRVNHKQL
jgi:hypothetical protein